MTIYPVAALYLSINQPINQSISQPIICQPIELPSYLSACLSVSLSVCLSTYLSACLPSSFVILPSPVLLSVDHCSFHSFFFPSFFSFFVFFFFSSFFLLLFFFFSSSFLLLFAQVELRMKEQQAILDRKRKKTLVKRVDEQGNTDFVYGNPRQATQFQ